MVTQDHLGPDLKMAEEPNSSDMTVSLRVQNATIPRLWAELNIILVSGGLSSELLVRRKSMAGI